MQGKKDRAPRRRWHKSKTLKREDRPARERGPNEVVISEPVIENRDQGLPLGVLFVHGGRLLRFLGLLGGLPVLLLLVLLVVLGLGLSTPGLLLLHHSLLRSLHGVSASVGFFCFRRQSLCVSVSSLNYLYSLLHSALYNVHTHAQLGNYT